MKEKTQQNLINEVNLEDEILVVEESKGKRILNAVVKLLKKAVVDIPTGIIFVLVAVGSYLLPISPVIFVLLAAVAGIALKSIGGKKA